MMIIMEVEIYWYDYGARLYDPTLLGVFNIDNYTEKYYSLTPYQYAANKSSNLIDINVDSIWITYPSSVTISLLRCRV